MNEIHWRAVVDDPVGALALLREQEAEAVQRLEEIRERRQLAEKMVATVEEWVTKFGPAPTAPGPEEGSDGGSAGPAAPPVVDPPGMPRRVRVMTLLGQDPGRWWKTREVAEALEIDNQKSLRILLSQLAKGGELVKSTNASYRFNDGRDIPEPEAKEGAAV